MKINQLITASLLTAGLSITSAQAATMFHGIGTSFTASSNTFGAGNPTDWSVTTVTGVTNGDGVTFDYSITLAGNAAPRSGNTSELIQTDNSNFENGDAFSVTIAVTGELGGTVVFNGFTFLRANQTSAGGIEGFAIEGTDYVRNAGTGQTEITVNGTNVGPLGTAGTLSATAVTPGNVRLGALEWQFTTTAVPEPSSTIFLGLGGLALVLRRRK